jgi:hypothetical protein
MVSERSGIFHVLHFDAEHKHTDECRPHKIDEGEKDDEDDGGQDKDRHTVVSWV